MMKKFAFCLLFILIFSSGVLAYHETKVLTLPADGIDFVDIETGAGECQIEGVSGLDRIEVTAEIRINNKSEREARKIMKDNLELSLKRRSGRGILKARFNFNQSLFSIIFGDGAQTGLDIVVRVPENMILDVEDSSGDLTISNLIGRLDVDDSSGDLTITNVVGQLDVEDSSGGLEISNVAGNMDVNDSSGELRLISIGGDIKIDDSSGNIIVRGVDGSLTIEDSSGSIDIDTVDGDVTIREDSSGGVNIRNVRGIVNNYDE